MVCVANGRFLTLLVSGGHTMLVLTEGIGQHTVLGSTIDDSGGEASQREGECQDVLVTTLFAQQWCPLSCSRSTFRILDLSKSLSARCPR